MDILKNTDKSKITLLELGIDASYTEPVKCNSLVLLLCKGGEVTVEINYVNYTLKNNGFLSVHPYDIVAFKDGSCDFMAQALILPVSVFTPIIAELKMTHYDYVKKNPLIYFDQNYLKILETTFELIAKASTLLDVERFEQVVVKQVASLFYVQQQFFTSNSDYNVDQHE